MYPLRSSYFSVDAAGASTDVRVMLNDSEIFRGYVNGNGPGNGTNFNANLLLAANDRLDFAVGFGGNGFYFDGTGIRVTLGSTVHSNLSVVVPGSANPWLAGAPDGTTAAEIGRAHV